MNISQKGNENIIKIKPKLNELEDDTIKFKKQRFDSYKRAIRYIAGSMKKGKNKNKKMYNIMHAKESLYTDMRMSEIITMGCNMSL